MTDQSTTLRDALASRLITRLENDELSDGVLSSAIAFLKAFPPPPQDDGEVPSASRLDPLLADYQRRMSARNLKLS